MHTAGKGSPSWALATPRRARALGKQEGSGPARSARKRHRLHHPRWQVGLCPELVEKGVRAPGRREQEAESGAIAEREQQQQEDTAADGALPVREAAGGEAGSPPRRSAGLGTVDATHSGLGLPGSREAHGCRDGR